MSAVEFTQEDLERAMSAKYIVPDIAWSPHTEAYRVAQRFGLRSEDLFSRSRMGRIPTARKALWKVLRARGWSYPEIANFTGHDHTTVLYALNGDTRTSKDARYKARRLRVADGVQVRGFDQGEAEVGVAQLEDLAQVPRRDLACGDGEEKGAARAVLLTRSVG